MLPTRISRTFSLVALWFLPLVGSAQPSNFYWDTDGAIEGAGGASPAGVWDGITANWSTDLNGTVDGTTWIDGNVAVFAAGLNATGAYPITVGNTITADAIQFEEGAVNLSGAEIDLTGSGGVDVASGLSATIGLAMGGSVGLTKSGAGSLTLSGPNTYSGTTTISAGTLTLGVTEIIPDGSAVSVASGAIFDLHNFSETVGSLAGAGNVSLGTGTLTTGGDGTSTIFSGAVGGAGGNLTKAGAGVLTLSGGNTYTGTTTISAGTLQLGAANRISDTSAVSVSSGATFDLNNFSETINSLADSGFVTLGSGNLTVGGAASTTYSGTMSGSGRLIKTGSGTLTVSGANMFTGGVTISGGVLSFPGETSAIAGDSNPLGAGPAAVVANYVILNGGGTLRSTHAGAGGSFLLANRGVSIGAGGGILDITSGTAGDYLIYGGIISGSGTVTKVGAGTLSLTTANTYTGNTTNSAGTIRIAAATVLGSISSSKLVFAGGNLASTVDANTYVQNPVIMLANATISGSPSAAAHAIVFGNASITTSGGTLNVRNTGTTAVAFQARFTNGGFNFTRPIVVGLAGTQPAQLDLYSDNLGATPIADQTFSGVISGPGSMRRTCAGDGTGGKSILAAANTYSGGTALNGGYLGFGIDSVGSPVTSGPVGTGTITMGQDASDGFYASGAARIVGNAITFGTGTNITIIGANALTMSGAVTLPALPTSLNVSNTALTTFSGAMSGGAAGVNFIKTGPGTLVLSNAHTYVDNTLIAAGILLVNNASGSGTGTGTVTANSGTTLGGYGRISGAVTMNNNSKLSPGSTSTTPGILTLQNGLNLSAGCTYVWELNTNSANSPGVNFDQIALTGGNLTLGGTAKLTVNFTGSATVPNLTNTFWRSAHSWTIIAGSGTAANPGSTRFTSVTSAQYPSLQYFTNTVDVSGNVVLIYDPNSPFYALTDAGPGFFAGENVILTNAADLALYVWSSARGGLSITNWNSEGKMGEQPLNDGSGKSRYSINVTPSVSPVYYIVGKTTSGPYAPTIPVQWITTDDFGAFTVFNTNVAINAAGVLDLPVPPDITQQPISKTTLSGKNASFSVTASSFTTMSYQWYLNSGTAISNATNSAITLNAATAGNIGSYSVLVTNAHGNTNSSIATLAVLPPPQLTTQPVGNGFQLSGPGVTGDIYWVQAATNLNTPTAWVTLITNVVAPSGLVQFTDTNASAQPNRFYRLVFP